jgi:putative sigma-54 modulation protein
MKIYSSFKHLEHTPSLDEKIQEKSHKLEKYFEGNFDVHWTCYIRDDGKHGADIRVHGPSFEYFASSYSESLYKTFDQVINKIERQLFKKKSKWKNKINRHNYDSPKHQFAKLMEKEERKGRERYNEEDVA